MKFIKFGQSNEIEHAITKLNGQGLYSIKRGITNLPFVWFLFIYTCVDFIQGACTESLDSQVQEATTHPPHPWNLWLVNHFLELC